MPSIALPGDGFYGLADGVVRRMAFGELFRRTYDYATGRRTERYLNRS